MEAVNAGRSNLRESATRAFLALEHHVVKLLIMLEWPAKR